MTLMVLAPPNSIWGYEYIKNVAIPLGFDKIELAIGERDRYCEYYEKHNIRIHTYSDENGKPDCQKLDNIIKTVGHCDWFHVQWAICSVRAFWVLSRIADNVAVSYWGSDLFDDGLFRAIVNFPMLCRARIIHVINDNMKKVMDIRYFHLFDRKVRAFDFGCSAYEHIDEVIGNKTIGQCKSHFRLPENKTVVCIGYNTREEQHHIPLIDRLNRLSGVDKARISVVVPWSYGDGREDYQERVESELIKTGIEYRFLFDFMEYDEISMLRRATDIFLYGQKTDAQAASMLEFLYAGTIVIKPAWLRYNELDSMGIRYHTYSEFDDISGIMQSILQSNIVKERDDLRANRDILYGFNSWNAVLPYWRGIYEQ